MSPLLQAWAADSRCLEALGGFSDREILRAYVEAWRTPHVYCAGVCQSNVVRLFQEMKRRLPGLDAKNFKVVIISNPGNWLSSPLHGFHVMSSRWGHQLRSDEQIKRGDIPVPVKWKFHVVLKYKHHILDLDATDSPKAFPSKRYLWEMFLEKPVTGMDGSLDDLVAYVIPGENYLDVDAENVNPWAYQETFYEKYPAVPLSSLAQP